MEIGVGQRRTGCDWCVLQSCACPHSRHEGPAGHQEDMIQSAKKCQTSLHWEVRGQVEPSLMDSKLNSVACFWYTVPVFMEKHVILYLVRSYEISLKI